jgi:hypothetical protein
MINLITIRKCDSVDKEHMIVASNRKCYMLSSDKNLNKKGHLEIGAMCTKIFVKLANEQQVPEA